jgi:parallel beta-helix repeat protein
MNKMKKLFAMQWTQKELRRGKRIMASIMLPILIFQMTSMNFLAMEMMTARAADGSGTMTVDDDDVTARGAAQNFKFTFDPSEDMDGGAVKVTIPSGWPEPKEDSGTDLDQDGEILVEEKNGADLDASEPENDLDVTVSGREVTINIQTMSASQYFTLKYHVAAIPAVIGDYEFTTESKLASGAFEDLSDSRQASVEIEPGVVASYVVTTPSGVKVGNDFDVTVTAKDADGNTTVGSSSVDLTAQVETGGALSGVLDGDMTADTTGDGLDTVSLKYTKAQDASNEIRIHAEKSGISGNSSYFQVAGLTAPVFTAPSGSSTSDSTPRVTWGAVTGSTVQYEFNLKASGTCASASDVSSPLIHKTNSQLTTVTSYQVADAEALLDETAYCVQVIATDVYGNHVEGYKLFNLLTSRPATPAGAEIELSGNATNFGHPVNTINIYNNSSVTVKVTRADSMTAGTVYAEISDDLGHVVTGTATISGAGAVSVTGIDASSIKQAPATEGTVRVRTRVEDSAGNPSNWSGYTTLAKDTSSPAQPSAVSFVDNPVNIANQVTVNISVTGENGAVAYYTVSGGGSVSDNFTMSGATTVSPDKDMHTLADGTLTASVYLVDSAWNHSSARTATVTKDAAAPMVVLTATETSPTNDSPLHITAQFSETVTGFDSGDLALVNGGLTGGSFVAVDGDTYTFQITPAGQGAVTINVAGSSAVDAVGNNNTAATQLSITFDSLAPTLAFTGAGNDVEAGPVISDTIVGDWGDASVKKWDYFADGDLTGGNCPSVAGSYSKADSVSMNQNNQDNNGKWICLYGEDTAGNSAVLKSANKINIDITGPTLSFTDNVEAGPVASDIIIGSWDDASVKMWKYNTDANCPDGPSGYTDSTSIPTQADQTNNGKYICLYGADTLGNESVLASSNDINIDSVAPTVTAISSPENSSSQNFNITYTANDGSGVGNIYGRIFYKLNGELIWNQYDYPGVGDDYVAYTGDNSTIEFVAPQPGSYEFYVQVKDELNNASVAETPVDTTNAAPEEVWVCESGACGHAAGWNDFNTIQAGIGAIRAGSNNRVNVSGSFTTDTYINVNKAVKLIGSSATITRTTGGAVVFIDANNARLEGFTLNVNNAAGSTGVYIDGQSGTTVTENTVTGSLPYSVGIYLIGSDSNTISNNIISNFVDDGISFGEGSDSNTFSRNTLVGSTSAEGSNAAFNVHGAATGNVLDDNTITLAESGTKNLFGFYFQGSVVGDNTVEDNVFNGGARFFQQDGGFSGTTTISDNSVGSTNSPNWGGIILGGGSAIISGNTLKNSVRPIEFWGAANVTITGNAIDGSTFDGINAGAASGIVEISGDNKIFNIANGSFGIHVQGGVDGIEIDGNELYGTFDGNDTTSGNSANGTRAIGIESGATGAKITNNNIHHNSWSAIVLNQAVNIITGNTFNANARGIETFASFVANNKNKFTNTLYCSACLYADGTFDLTQNWWGTNQRSGIIAQVADNGRAYTYAPWYMEEGMTTLSSSDTTGPTVVLSDDHADTLVNKNDAVLITATFFDVNGLDSGITPKITITNGGVAGVVMTATADSNVWTYSWDVPEGDGTATVSVEAYDIIGNANQAATGNTSYTIDNTAPTIAPVTLVPTPTNNSTPNYTFSSNQAGTITYGGSSCSSSTSSAIADNNTIAFNALTSGTYNCTIQVTDVAGNSSNVLNVNTFTVDLDVPTISSITSSTGSGNYNSGDPINVTVTFSENVTLIGGNLNVTLDTGDVVMIAPFADSLTASGAYTVGVGDNSADLDSTGIALSGGTLQDAAGNDASVALPDTTIADGSAIIVDTLVPTGRVAVDTDPIYEGDLVQIVTVTYDEAMHPASTPIITFGATTGAVSSTGDGAWSDVDTWTETFNIIDANEARQDVSVSSSSATDLAGNVEGVSVADDFDVDTIASTITIINPNTDPAQSKTVTASADGSATLTMVINDAGVSTCNGALAFGAYADTTFTEEADNTKTICYRAIDPAGNITYTLSGVIGGIDRTAPTVVLSDDHAGSIVKNGETVLITATFDEADQVDEASAPRITINSDLLVDNVLMTKLGGDNKVWTYAWVIPTGHDGTHTISISAQDRAGNISEAVTAAPGETTVYIIDNTAPTGTSVTVNGGDSYATSTSSTLTLTATDSWAPVKMKISNDGVFDSEVWEDFSSSKSWTLDGANGTKTVSVLFEDGGNNIISSAVTDTIVLDTVAPSIPTGLVATPASWTPTNSFDLSWTNEADTSGIAGAYYKLDSAPTDNADGTYVAGSSIVSLSSISVIGEGAHTVYVWLEDNAGLVNYANRANTILNFDATASSAPTVTSSTHPVEANWYNNNDPALDWSGLDDTSGITGYSYSFDHSATADPGDVSEGVATAITYTDVADGTWYFHIKAKNGSGLWSEVTHRTINIDTSTPSSSVTSTDYDKTGTISVNIAILVANPSGVHDVDLYARYDANRDGDYIDTNEFDWTNKNLTPTANAVAGEFTFNPLDLDGQYQFYSRAENNTGTWEAEPAGDVADDSTIFDHTNPGDPTGFGVTSGAPYDTWTKTATSTAIAWTAATDATAGLDGYNILWDQTADTALVDTKTTHADGSIWIEEGIVASTKTAMTDGLWYFHIKSRDNAGNWADTTHYGPFKIDTTDPDIELNHDADFENNTGDSIQISADVTDDGSGVDEVLLYWRQEGGSWNEEEMNDGAGDEYTKTIPAQYNPNVDIEYYIEAVDNVDNDSSDGTSGDPHKVNIVSEVDGFVINTDTTQTDGSGFAATITAKDEYNNDASFAGTAVVSVDAYSGGSWVDLNEDSYAVTVNGTETDNVNFNNQISRSIIVSLHGTGITLYPTIRIHVQKSTDAGVSGDSANISISGFSATVAGVESNGSDGSVQGDQAPAGDEGTLGEGANKNVEVVPVGNNPWYRSLPFEIFVALIFGSTIWWWIRRRGVSGGAGGFSSFMFTTLKTAANRARMFLW